MNTRSLSVAALAAVGGACASVLAGCAAAPTPTVNYAAAPASALPPTVEVVVAQPPVPAPAPLLGVPFDTAIVNAAAALFRNAGIDATRVVVIDPLIDGVSGEQTTASSYIETRLRDIARDQFPKLDIRDFSSDNVAKGPMVLVGTFTGITLDNKTVGKPEAYRICLALADFSTNKIVAKGVARSLLHGVNSTPTPYFSDTPVWVKDQTVEAYIKTCQGSKVGDAIDPIYRDDIETATVIADAIVACEKRNFREALDLYGRAVQTTTGDQLRIHSGLYLANWKLGKRSDAEKAFGKIVDHGLAAQKLAVKFLFQPRSTEFWTDTNVSGPYPIWLRQIATRVAKADNCLEIVGHTSRSGSELANDKLSLARAQNVKRKMDATVPALAAKTKASGVGFRENVVGSGADDLTDLQDRRVEFRLAKCVS
ncbi:MAG: OmpA family protein [Rhizobacter sp.]|nr:OmpA family protein [Burkholderiales bacterium]